MSIAVVDYGAGNLSSVCKILRLFADDVALVDTPEAIAAADRIVLPGVGAAGEALQRLRARGLDEALNEAVTKQGRPLLGICLGMQMLADRLTEFGDHRGLGWIAGQVVHLHEVPDLDAARVPHMGWNRVTVAGASPSYFDRYLTGQEFYFAHSFTLRTPNAAAVRATCDYGAPLVAAVHVDTVLATQFHPEKSQVAGEKLILAFLDWSP